MGDRMTLTKKFHLHLLGPFVLETIDGEDLTPKAQKSRALLSMLAVSPRGLRSRAWLRDKLWSDRYENRAAASLRQSLLDIRKTLGPHADTILLTDKHTIGLDLRHIHVDALENPASLYTRQMRKLCGEHFLEGMDIRDPEFEEWLTIERQVWQERLAATASSQGQQSPFRSHQPDDPTCEGISESQSDKVESDTTGTHEEWVLSLSIAATKGTSLFNLSALDLVRTLEGATLTIKRRPARRGG